MTADGKSETGIKKSIGIAKKAFKDLEQVLKIKKIGLKTKKRILKCYVWFTLLCGCESWTKSKAMQERLEVAEIWFL